MKEKALRTLGTGYLRSVLATYLDDELPGVDFPALIQRVREKG
jgi:hypothetical protein